MELEDGYKTACGSGSGTQSGYSVEARSRKGAAKIGGMLLSEQWQKIDFPKGKPGDKGVPAPGGYDSSGQLERHGLYSYASAQALRWWLHAVADDCDADRSGWGLLKRATCYGIETRLVKHEVKYQYTITATSAHEVVDDVLGPKKEQEPADCAPLTRE